MSSPALGDTLLFSGPLQDLRQQFPAATIVHVCMKQNLAAAEMIRGANRRIVIDLTRPAETISALRREHFDVFLDFTAWQRLTAFYTLMSGARFTAGFRTSGQHREVGYDVIADHLNTRHELENFRALLKAVGVKTGSTPAIIVPEISGIKGTGLNHEYFVFHPWAGTKAEIREWPKASWVSLAKALSFPGAGFVITGSRGDQSRVEELVARMRAEGLTAEAFIGTDGFVSLSHLLLRARAVISVNTGVMHLAAILGCPTVSINGPTNNNRWGPVGERVVGVAAPGNGCGFLNLGFEFEGQPMDCMARTTVSHVLAAVQQITSPSGLSLDCQTVDRV